MRLKGLLSWAAAAWLFTAPATATEVDAARDAVARFQDALIVNMKDGPELGYAGRLARIAPVLEETFDFDVVTRLVLGERWKAMSGEERSRFRGLIARLGAATLAARFDSHDGQSFDVVEAKAVAKERVQVRSHFGAPGSDPVQVDYLLHESADSTRVMNVWFQGVSSAHINRDEFAAIAGERGLDGLALELEKKIRAYAASGG